MNERIKTLLYVPLSHASVRRSLESIPYLSDKLPLGQRTHPIDRQYGIDTSGFVPARLIITDKAQQSQISPYTGSQPDVIRAAISALGEVDEYGFIDIGCGKGRAMVVASEFPFRHVMGVELSPRLAKIAARNMAIIKQRFSARPTFTVIGGNALTVPLPEGKLVIFLYHPFGADLVSELVKKLEIGLTPRSEPLFFVYYNPVHGEIVDASSKFTRWYAKTFSCATSDLGENSKETVVIWQSVHAESNKTPHADADRPILIVDPLWKADLA
jgi:SAM-dependent methyltransferase